MDNISSSSSSNNSSNTTVASWPSLWNMTTDNAYASLRNATPTGDPVNSTANVSDPYEKFYLDAQFATGMVIIPICCLTGILGNILTLIILNKKSMRTSTNAYLSALLVADTIKLLNDTLYFVTILASYIDPPTGDLLYGYLYPYAHFIFSLSTCISSWMTVAVALERFLLVCFPTQSRGWCTLQRAQFISSAVFVIMIAIALPSALRYRTVENYDNATETTSLTVVTTALWKNEKFVTAYTWVQSLLRSIIPLCILIFLNYRIICALNKSRANKKMQSRNRITIMLISVIVVFIICVTPDAVMSFVGAGYHDEQSWLIKGIREITDSLLSANAASNIFLYCAFNKLFRQQFLAMFCKQMVDPKLMDESQYRKLPENSPNSNDGITCSPTKETMLPTTTNQTQV
ncbi:FMRFamide receptor-like [Tubulanus polymorphus]|uniref:FMRFamide receptor-like n=1 Tax=Tubulanus polymorphus TaxID=672921 RepID=UPI003DA1F4DF